MRMSTLKMTSAFAFAIACFSAAPVAAATFLFDLSGARNATFTIEGDPVVPDSINSQPLLGGSQIFFNNVNGIFNGVSGTGNINFGTGNIIAALNISAPGLGFTQYGGTDLFSFVDGQPVFNLGTFNFSGFIGQSTLTISEVPGTGAVPEPETWLMMLMGFGLVGGILRSTKGRERLSLTAS
ncbi:PEPxxWA-CTERM sorting domain-containing protein [Polymorphobacter sp.]|uniref:PEPxxWA-CTERM sorting domain-containing protein n=1 Tax=Polymorphobacter sp. TaxID=1909290 RepID=UPI003F72348A